VHGYLETWRLRPTEYYYKRIKDLRERNRERERERERERSDLFIEKL